MLKSVETVFPRDEHTNRSSNTPQSALTACTQVALHRPWTCSHPSKPPKAAGITGAQHRHSPFSFLTHYKCWGQYWSACTNKPIATPLFVGQNCQHFWIKGNGITHCWSNHCFPKHLCALPHHRPQTFNITGRWLTFTCFIFFKTRSHRTALAGLELVM